MPALLGEQAKKYKFGKIDISGREFRIYPPDSHEFVLKKLMENKKPFIVVDFTHPTAVNMNARLYCHLGIPFVMGTTGGDREELERIIQTSPTSAVIAPNMAKQIVGFQAMMDYAAKNFPGLFDGFQMKILESHQAGKADTSGTAKAMVEHFNAMGVSFSVDQIQMIRSAEEQKKLGVPEKCLNGHGWHTYRLESDDGTVYFSFTHNVNGRDIYCRGTADAIRFLAVMVQQGERGRAFSMIDVLRGV